MPPSSSSPLSSFDPITKQVLRPMMWTITVLIGVGLLITVIQPIASRFTSLLLALACILLGGFVGFLFGIPRVLQATNEPPAPATNPSTPPATPADYRQQVNTNLEQISDWLTKIIVGLGLVNLYKIPDLLRDTSELIARGMATSKNIAMATIFANSLILYFPVLGFLIGYLITRIFLSGVFRKADTGELGLVIGGQEVAIADVVKNLVNVVTDSQAAKPEEQGVKSPPALKPKRILWVDDNPNNNIIERETMNKAGIEVIPAVSTDEALSQLAKNEFDLIISDMGRTEKGYYNPSAGVYFLQQMKASNMPHIRTLIYCSMQGAKQYGTEARQAGADEILYGPQALMKAIGLN